MRLAPKFSSQPPTARLVCQWCAVWWTIRACYCARVRACTWCVALRVVDALLIPFVVIFYRAARGPYQPDAIDFNEDTRGSYRAPAAPTGQSGAAAAATQDDLDEL